MSSYVTGDNNETVLNNELTVRVSIVAGDVFMLIWPATAVILMPDMKTGPLALFVSSVTQCAAVTTNDGLTIDPPQRYDPELE